MKPRFRCPESGRRSFIASALACGAMPYLRTFASQAKPHLRVGVISDIHVRGPGKTLDSFIAALKWYDWQKVDAVAVAGDLADFGLVEELRYVGKAWDDVFPGDRASDSRRVEKIFVTGNHDNHFYNHPRIQKIYPDKEERFARSIARDFDAAWRECFHEPFSPFFVKEVKGYRFLGAQYGKQGLADFVAERKRFFEDRSKAFFYVQHQHLRNTCHGPDAWGQDKGESTKVLGAFPNAVAFSGHSHYPLTDERCIWQGAFTSIGTGSLNYIVPPGGVDYENGTDTAKDRVRQMPGLSWGQSNHALLMDVFDDRIELSRWALEKGAFSSLGAPWVLPQPFAEPPPFAFASRASKVAVPEFAAGTKVRMEVGEGMNRKKEKVMQVKLRFPEATAGGRVFDYEVCAEPVDPSRGKLVRYVLSPNFHLAKKLYATATCNFGVDELPGACRFSIAPRSSFRRAGKAVYSETYAPATGDSGVG